MRTVKDDNALFGTKFSSPRGQSGAILRERLTSIIGDLQQKLVIVRAPAGFGKTTLLQQWQDELSRRDVATAWLTLDGADNDPAQLAASLQATIAKPPASPPGPDLADLPRTLRDGLSRSAFDKLEAVARFVIFIDEIEVLESDAARGVVQGLLRETPPTVQIVVAGRSIPGFGQGRLRLRDDVVILDGEDLRFRIEETKAFLAQRVPRVLNDDEVRALQRDTDGWVAALQLAGLSIRDAKSADVTTLLSSGFDRDVADYLHEDVFDKQGEAIRKFLLETSVCRLLTGSLCDAITGRQDGEATLAHLEATGLFLSRLSSDDGRVWYRFHAMFADFLRGELRLRRPGDVERLHLSACGWLARHALVAEASEHARLAGNQEMAFKLLDSIAIEQIWKGRLRTVLDWSADLTLEQGLRFTRLYSASLWAEGFVGDARAATQRLDDLVLANNDGRLPSSDFLSDTLTCLPILFASGRLDLATMRRDGPSALSRIMRKGSFEEGTLACCVAYAYVSSGELDLAREALSLAKRASHAGLGTYNLAYTQFAEAQLHLCAMEPDRAALALRFGNEGGHPDYGIDSQSSAITASLHSQVLYEVGELDRAGQMLDQHLPMIGETFPDCVVSGFGTAAALRIVRGDFEGAREILFDGEINGLRRASEAIVHAMRWQSAWVAAITRDMVGAMKLRDELVIADATLDAAIMSPVDALIRDLYRIRIDIRLGRASDLLPLFDPLISAAQNRQLGPRGLRLRILKAYALEAAGHSDKAAQAMAAAMRLGIPSGFVQCFLDEGPAVVDLVIRSRPSLADLEPSPRLLRFDTILDQLKPAQLVNSGSAYGARKPISDVLDLTQREAEILAVLRKGLSNREIGELLKVSENTIKWHLRNIFDKMGVSNRTEASFLLDPAAAPLQHTPT